MNWSKLSQLSKEELKEVQNKKLSYFIKHEIPYSPFYRKIFEEHKVDFGDIQTTDDLQKLLFTQKQDIAPTKDDPAKPRQFILQPDEKLIKKYASKKTLLK